jgi:hypothetical protein
LDGDCEAAVGDTVSTVSSDRPPFLHRLQRDVGRHDLGHRRGVPGHGRVFGLEDLAGIGFDDQQRFGVRDAWRHDGKRRRKEDPVERVARQQASKMHFCVPVL